MTPISARATPKLADAVPVPVMPEPVGPIVVLTVAPEALLCDGVRQLNGFRFGKRHAASRTAGRSAEGQDRE